MVDRYGSGSCSDRGCCDEPGYCGSRGHPAPDRSGRRRARRFADARAVSPHEPGDDPSGKSPARQYHFLVVAALMLVGALALSAVPLLRRPDPTTGARRQERRARFRRAPLLVGWLLYALEQLALEGRSTDHATDAARGLRDGGRSRLTARE